MSEKMCPICGCHRDPGYKESVKYLCGYWETPGKAHVSGCGNALQVVNELRAQLNIERNHCESSAATITTLRAKLQAAKELLAAAKSFVNAALRKWDGGIECLNCDTNTVPPEPQKHKEWCEIKTFQAAIALCDKAVSRFDPWYYDDKQLDCWRCKYCGGVSLGYAEGDYNDVRHLDNCSYMCDKAKGER
jgi:hypothetical protein